MVGTGRFELPTPRFGANNMGFSEFIRERQYLSNVSPSTPQWYKYSFKWLDTESPTQDDLKAAVLKMRAKGLRATGCNSAIRAINAYAHWASAGPDVKCAYVLQNQLQLFTETPSWTSLRLAGYAPGTPTEEQPAGSRELFAYLQPRGSFDSARSSGPGELDGESCLEAVRRATAASLAASLFPGPGGAKHIPRRALPAGARILQHPCPFF